MVYSPKIQQRCTKCNNRDAKMKRREQRVEDKRFLSGADRELGTILGTSGPSGDTRADCEVLWEDCHVFFKHFFRKMSLSPFNKHFYNPLRDL